MELVILGLFCGLLLGCLSAGLPMPLALTGGLVLFLLYGAKKGFSARALWDMSMEGVKTVTNILIAFMLVGMLTGLWRAGGTIPVLVSYAATLIRPGIMYLMTFLLCCLVSLLTGTAFGTAATMGVVCATMSAGLSLSPMITGGAILAGSYFGDRTSPMSSIVLLVGQITGVNIFDNIKRMTKTCLLPLALSCGLYALLGTTVSVQGEVPDLSALFSREFVMHPAALLPAAVIMVLSLCKVNVKIAMTASILTAIPVCILLQGMTVTEVLSVALAGFAASDPEVAAMVSGGGMVTMINTSLIVMISASYSGIFKHTGLLDRFKSAIAALAEATTPMTAMVITSIPASFVACNQTLSIMLTHQLCQDIVPDKDDMALSLSDSAVVIPPLVPWSIAGAVPLAGAGAPTSSILASFYLFLLPLTRVIGSLIRKKRERSIAK